MRGSGMFLTLRLDARIRLTTQMSGITADCGDSHLSTGPLLLQVILAHGGQVDESYSNRVTHVLCEHQRSDVFQLVSTPDS